ncbi:MAG TPA: flagellar motor switch protein FliN [Nocardioidaceae bacterium]|nr:flagellar motor switch protein FliN [Nocardioidaceae bacterium]
MINSNTAQVRGINEATVLEAARAAAATLPAAQPLVVGTPEVGAVAGAAVSAGAAVAQLGGLTGGAVAVLVGEDLVAALASSPLGELDLAAAVQPALDAAAAAMGAAAQGGTTVDPELLEEELGTPFTAVPLLAGTTTHAILLVTNRTVETRAPSASDAEPRPRIGGKRQGIELLHGVVMDVTVELGRTRMSVRDLLELTPGTVLELDRAAGSPADLLVNGRLIARGEVVVVDEDFGLRVTEIITNTEAAAS